MILGSWMWALWGAKFTAPPTSTSWQSRGWCLPMPMHRLQIVPPVGPPVSVGSGHPGREFTRWVNQNGEMPGTGCLFPRPTVCISKMKSLPLPRNSSGRATAPHRWGNGIWERIRPPRELISMLPEIRGGLPVLTLVPIKTRISRMVRKGNT